MQVCRRTKVSNIRQKREKADHADFWGNPEQTGPSAYIKSAQGYLDQNKRKVVPRSGPSLSVSRSIGDFHCKSNETLDAKDQMVTGNPLSP